MEPCETYEEQTEKAEQLAYNDMMEMEEFAKVITQMIQRRKQLGLSQRDLAKLCGLPQSSVARFETMTTLPRFNTLLKMWYHLGLTLTLKEKDPIAVKVE